MSRRTYQTVQRWLRRRLFDLPQIASATAMPIIAEARTHQNQHFFSILLATFRRKNSGLNPLI
jgi:hypothetical protein